MDKPFRFVDVFPLAPETWPKAPPALHKITPHYLDLHILAVHLSITRRAVCAWASVSPKEWALPVMPWPPHEFNTPYKRSHWIWLPEVRAARDQAQRDAKRQSQKDAPPAGVSAIVKAFGKLGFGSS